ncbi:MAG: hypothetical protein GKR95_25330 [Gammaproteobacteria bacterium]|nr:hypothetical protein [Gammaproteobacteria bacterium]
MKSPSLFLGQADAANYRAKGFLFPIPVLMQDEQLHYRKMAKNFYHALAPEERRGYAGQSHLSFTWAYNLCTHPNVLDAVELILGPDILVHSTTVFLKPPGNSFVSWHQDATYWGLSAPRLVSAWIALSDSTTDNGCLRVIPGSHLQLREHTEIHNQNNMLTTGSTLKDTMDESLAVDVTLRAGEMSFHHANLVHGSNTNNSSGNRVGFAVRYVSPEVQHERPHHEVVLARGLDQFGYYTHLAAPPRCSFEDGLVRHRQKRQWLSEQRMDGVGESK